jgi:hypothetical protein
VVAAIQQSPNLTRLFEANTVRIFEGVDRTLLLREAYERDPAHFDLPDWSRRTAPVGDFTPILRLIGPDGYTIEPTAHWNQRMSATAIISAPRSMPTDELFIDKPAIGQVTGRLTIQISRPASSERRS